MLPSAAPLEIAFEGLVVVLLNSVAIVVELTKTG